MISKKKSNIFYYPLKNNEKKKKKTSLVTQKDDMTGKALGFIVGIKNPSWKADPCIIVNISLNVKYSPDVLKIKRTKVLI